MPRILHLGLGNFHRAHQAWHTAHAGGWPITGVVMGNRALFDALQRQTGHYHLGIRSVGGLSVERITLHDRLILARDDPQSVIAAIADPDTHIITLTVTEKGYCLGPDGRLDLGNPAVLSDLSDGPRSAIGMLAHGLARREDPVTVISCDNISGNGRTLGAAIRDFARAAALELTAGIRFPDTMVDRITPATTAAIQAEIEAETGTPDEAPVLTEAFSEWIIEDDFAGPRPEWERAGVEIVPDVAPYEKRKLRLLNAAHSYLAYAGLSAGHRYVHEAMADPDLRAGVERLWDEAQTTLPGIVQPTLPTYRAALVDRFAVAEMRHELAQIACDGSLKLRERLVPIIAEQTAAPQARQAVAAWMAFVVNAHGTGQPLTDPNAERISKLIEDCSAPDVLCKSLAGLVSLADLSEEDWATLAADFARLSRQL